MPLLPKISLAPFAVSVLLLGMDATGGRSQSLTFVVDGRLDDAIWQTIPAEKLTPSAAGVAAGLGGEIRATVVGRRVFVSARLPEPTGRVTARMIGRNPIWEDEDLLRIVFGPDIGFSDREVKINPLGGYSVERNGQFVHMYADRYLVATRIEPAAWTVEAVLPLNLVGAPGSEPVVMTVERIRAARPGSPQQRWHWPDAGPAARVRVSSRDWNLEAPPYKPEPIVGQEPPLEVGRSSALPAIDAGWDDPSWRDVPAWKLLREEPAARASRAPAEVRLLHDGRTLAVLARCLEPGKVIVSPRDGRGRAIAEDDFRVYLAASGSAYAQVVVNADNYIESASGLAGGSRISRPREWDSGARAHVRRAEGTWVARIDIPLESAARALGETELPSEWRVLIRRTRPARDGEPAEVSVLPVTGSDTPLCPARYRRLRLTDQAPSQLHAAPSTFAAAPFDTRVLSRDERAKQDVAGMLERRIRERIQKIAKEEDLAWEKVGSREDWERFREPRIKALAASFGAFPERTPLRLRVTKEFAGRGYRRQDLIYESRPGLWVTANLYLPAEPPSRMPGIVIVHSHHRPRTQAELQDMGILWARVGCAVLVMDQLGHGERLQNYPWNREAYHSRYLMGMQLYLAGESLLKWLVWDVMRGIDLLLERGDVDSEKIVLLGAVAAGGEPAAVTAALDPRVKAVASFNFGRTAPGSGEWESTRCLRNSISGRFFPWVIGASVLPRRLVDASEMGWESYRNHENWNRFQKIADFYGVPDHVDTAFGFGTFPGPGECTNIGPAQRKTLYPELNRWFGIPIPTEEPDDRRPEAEMASLTPQIAAEIGMKDLHELAREVAERKLSAVRTELANLSPDARRERLRREWAARLGDIEPSARFEASSRAKTQWKQAKVESITIQVEPGIVVPLLLMKPSNASTGRLPVVLALSQGGKERILAHRLAEVEHLLSGGVAVCVPDVRGAGETSPDQGRGPDSEEVTLSATEFMLGGTLLGGRLKDVRTVLAYLRGRPDLDAARIALWGDSEAPVNPERLMLDEVPGWQISPVIQRQAEPMGGLLALLASLYEDGVRAVAVRGSLVGYLSVLDDNFTYVPNDVIVPGALEAGDLCDVAAVVAPRPLLLEGLVDGRNRTVAEPSLKKWLAPAFAAYRAASGNLVVRSAPREPELAAWIRKNL